METAEYWLMACKYGIWNTTIASLQFWAEDLNPITLGIASSGHPQATHYDSYLKMFYLDVLLLHSMQHLPSSYLWHMKVTRVVPTLT